MAAILLVCSLPSVSSACRQLLAGAGHTVVTASTSDEAIRLLLTLKVQAIVLDCRIDGGYSDLRRWLRADSDRASVHTIYLVPPATLDLDILPPDGFRPSVDAVLPRPFVPEKLPETVSALLGAPGRRGFEREMRAGPFSVDLGRQVLSTRECSVRVTPIEGRLIRYLMERPGVPVGVDELLVEVWGYHPGTGGPEVVRAHVRNLRRKLHSLAPSHDVLVNVPRLGYRFVAKVEGGSP